MIETRPRTILTPQTAAYAVGPHMLDETECRRWVITATRGEHPQCPACSAGFVVPECDRLLDGKSVICGACGVKSSPRSGTALEGSTLSDRQVVFVLAMLHWEISPRTIARMANCAPSTVYAWRQRMQP